MTARGRQTERRGYGRQRGLALVGVLWAVVILGMVVAGVSVAVRSEIRHVASVNEQVRADALASAAMHAVAAKLLITPNRPPRPIVFEMDLFDRKAVVTARLLNGLIDLNGAPVELLSAAFQFGLGVSSEQAQVLARDAVAFRDRRDRTGQSLRFAGVEELQSVLGADYDAYARVAPLFTAEGTGWARVNPLAAPPEVLLVLAAGNGAASALYAQQRDSGDPAMDATQLTQRFLDPSIGNRYRLEVQLPQPDGTSVARHGLLLLQTDPESGTPWMLMRTWRPLAALP